MFACMYVCDERSKCMCMMSEVYVVVLYWTLVL